MPDDRGFEAGDSEPLLEINTPNTGGGSKTSMIFVLIIVFVLLISGFLVFYKYFTFSQAADKQRSFDSLLTEIGNKKNAEIEDKANQLNSAVKIISTASKSKYLFKSFIDEMTTKITNDTKLDNLAIDNFGHITIDGQSGSYRSVADLAVALGTSKKLENVQIAGLATASESGTSIVSFSITADIKDWKDQASESAATDEEIGVGNE